MSAPQSLHDDRRLVVDIAVQAGKILLDWRGRLTSTDVSSKSAARDLVTAADLASEEFILRSLKAAFPQDDFLAEESAAQTNASDGTVWCVDPLDGTVNFVHGIPMYAVSIARLRNGKPDLAVVHLPCLGETFHARKGGGAWLGARQISVSSAAKPLESLLATGFPYRRHELADNNLENFQRMFLHQQGVRRMGSAATDLAYVAAGRLDGFWELHLSPWDVAAGVLLVSEAGGIVDTIVPGGDYLFGGNLIAGPEKLVAGMREILLAGRDPSYPDLGDKST